MTGYPCYVIIRFFGLGFSSKPKTIPGDKFWGYPHCRKPIWLDAAGGMLSPSQFHGGFQLLMGRYPTLSQRMLRKKGVRSHETYPDANHGAGIFTYMTGSFLGFLCRCQYSSTMVRIWDIKMDDDYRCSPMTLAGNPGNHGSFRKVPTEPSVPKTRPAVWLSKHGESSSVGITVMGSKYFAGSCLDDSLLPSR